MTRLRWFIAVLALLSSGVAGLVLTAAPSAADVSLSCELDPAGFSCHAIID